jgi:tetratricopeptide (TPR) repeat protein
VVLAVALWSRETSDERNLRLCGAHVQSEVDEVWSARRRAEIEESFSKAQGAWAWVPVRDRFGGEVDRWKDASLAACQLSSSDARRRTASCLEERRKTLKSMSDLFAAADLGVATHALNTVMAEVQPIESCLETMRDEAPTVIKPDVDESMRFGLAQARVLKTAGKYDRAVIEARRVANMAEDAHADRVKAEAQLLVGELNVLLGRNDAEENLQVAIFTAEAVGNDEVRARAWIALMGWYTDRHRIKEATQAGRVTASILERMRRPALLESFRLNQQGELYAVQDETYEAQRMFEQALELQRQLKLGEDHPVTMRTLNNLGNVLPPAEAVPLFEKVLAIRKRAFGPEHPEIAAALYNLGVAHLEAHECDKALARFEEALAVESKNPQDEPLWLGHQYVAVAEAQQCLLKLADAEKSLVRGVELLEKGGAPDDELKQQQANLETLCRKTRPSHGK